MGFDRVVRHRQQADAGLPAFAQHPGDLRQRLARREQLGPHDVRREVAVAEREPRRARTVRPELVADGERLVRAAPSLLLADAAAEGVHDRVQVRAHAQAEQGDVVTGIAEDGDLSARGSRLQAAQEARCADAAGEDG